MRNWKFLAAMMAGGSLLGACEAEEEPNQVTPEVIEVELLLTENQPVGEEITLQAGVTQDEEMVKDAREVEFEVWQGEDRENGELVPGVHRRDGIYEAPYTFEEDGVYRVQAHVTARDMHMMPVISVAAGDAEITEDDEEVEEGTHHNHD
ncbi:FixH family protein [Shouchella shacheensis]|uniref:FixH family protein n=1 Tax=Shouchella shacheensis TaxID=1649580 RepID=UPI00073FF693|nr:FixH family protein [Shouchella shacheensis]